MSMPASRARRAALHFATEVGHDEPVAAHQHSFASWCEVHGLSPLPAHPHTVGLYLTARAHTWALTTLKKAKNAIGRQHREHELLDPTHDPLVQRLWKAIARAKRGETRHQVDPLTAPLLAVICSSAASDRGPRAEAITVRAQIAAIVARRHQISPSRLVCTGRRDIESTPSRLVIDVPGRRDRGGNQMPSKLVVVDAAGDPWGLIPKMRRLLDLVPLDNDARPLCLRRTGSAWDFTSGRNAAAIIAHELHAAAERAGLASGGPPAEWLGRLTDAEFGRLLDHCDRWHRTDLRNRAMVAVGFALALRPCETRGLRRRGVQRTEDGFLVAVRRAKQRGTVEDKVLSHWPGCPPHCPACLLGAWLDDVGVSLTSGALFPSKVRGGIGTEMTDGAHKFVVRSMVERAGITRRISPKSTRSGLATSLAEAGAETEDITAVTDHTTADVLRRHYLLTTKVAATHQLGKDVRGPGA